MTSITFLVALKGGDGWDSVNSFFHKIIIANKDAALLPASYLGQVIFIHYLI
jgi:hypothetical protein